MKKYRNGILFGMIAGVINCIFLLFAKDLEVTVFISTFFVWVVTGLFVSSVDFQLNGILKGIVVSFFLSLSSLIYTFSNNLLGGMWTFTTTMILGAFMGYIIDRVNTK